MNIYLIMLILLLPLPLYVWYKKSAGKRREGKNAYDLKVAFYQLSRKHKLSIHEVEIFNNKVIGIDKNIGKLLWVEYIDNNLRQSYISLNGLESHRVRKVSDKTGSGTRKVVLEVSHKNQKPEWLTFYDSSTDNRAALAFLREKAKYWNAKIHFFVKASNSRQMFEYVI
jgi:hypothetical protein